MSRLYTGSPVELTPQRHHFSFTCGDGTVGLLLCCFADGTMDVLTEDGSIEVFHRDQLAAFNWAGWLPPSLEDMADQLDSIMNPEMNSDSWDDCGL